MKKTIIYIIFLFATINLQAQGLQAMLNHYSTENGLPSNAISDIIQDKFGYIWISSWNGLCRYDGYDFFQYATGTASGIPFLHNRILDMYADTQGNIWLRMYDNRIFVLNRKTDLIQNAFEGISNGINIRTDRPLAVSSDGHVFAIINGQGIYRMSLENNHFSRHLYPIRGINITKIVFDKHGKIWLSTNKGLATLNTTTGKTSFYYIPGMKSITSITNFENLICIGTHSGDIYFIDADKPYKSNKSTHLTDDPITSLNVDSKGMVWYTTYDQGVSRYSLKDKTQKTFTQIVPAPESDLHGSTIFEYGDILWVRMNHGGFGYYDRQKDVINYFYNNPDNSLNLSNTVATYLALPEGVVWMSTNRRGLEKLELLNERIKRDYVRPGSTEFGVNEVRAMLYDKKNNQIIIGNKKGELFIYDSSLRRQISHLSMEGRIYGLIQDHKGNVWVSNKDKGLFVIKSGTKTITPIKNLNCNATYIVTEDYHGNIWVATYGGGVNMIKPDGSVLYPGHGIKGYPLDSYLKVRAITLASDGSVWAGTTDGILILKYDARHNRIKTEILHQTSKIEEQLGNNDIIQIVKAHDGSMWIATNGGGLGHSIGKDENGYWKFETFGGKDGLPSDEIRSITFSNDGSIWFAADQSICSYDPQKKLFTTFSIQDGVGGIACSESAAITLPDSRMLFGTLNGYYVVDRSRLTNQLGRTLRLAITDFYINDQLMTPRTNDTYKYYIPDSNYVKLPGRSSVFAFRFASLNYQLQHRVHYQYMLEGYDDHWLNADRNRMVSYSDVPSGTYKFKVKAFLLESPNKYDERTITVVVPPYILASPAALWTYLCLLIIATAIFLYRRHQLKIKRQENIKKMRVLKVGPDEIAFQQQDDYEFVKRILDWLELHYYESSLKIDDMVSQSSLSRTSFYNQLKTLTGLSPKEFISDFRLKKAAMYLENDECTIAEVTYKTGFNDPVYFARIFKQKMGMTPSKYREEKHIKPEGKS
jgi:ligand-binding sensor domain-containing protein/AraC-like DNA-binding protein